MRLSGRPVHKPYPVGRNRFCVECDHPVLVSDKSVYTDYGEGLRRRAGVEVFVAAISRAVGIDDVLLGFGVDRESAESWTRTVRIASSSSLATV